MPDLSIEVYPARDPLPDDDGGQPLVFKADFLSFVNGDTYGVPALLGPGEGHQPGPKVVVYVNVDNVAAILVEKLA